MRSSRAGTTIVVVMFLSAKGLLKALNNGAIKATPAAEISGCALQLRLDHTEDFLKL